MRTIIDAICAVVLLIGALTCAYGLFLIAVEIWPVIVMFIVLGLFTFCVGRVLDRYES